MTPGDPHPSTPTPPPGDEGQTRSERLAEIFGQARERPPDLREAFVHQACAGDLGMELEIKGLLANDLQTRQRDDLVRLIRGTLSGDASGKDVPPTTLLTLGERWRTSVHEAATLLAPFGYAISGQIGAGSTGEVYQGRQLTPERDVAVKIGAGPLSAHELEAFKREADVLAKLDHPGIAKVFASGVAGSDLRPIPFIVMELVPGARPLIDALGATPTPTRRRLEVFAAVCDAVAHLHARGIVHRDLKPSNILVGADGRTKVVDLGIAHDQAAVTLYTKKGGPLGTLRYMAPEQCDPALGLTTSSADVYSLGAILFELVCGRPAIDLAGLEFAAQAARVANPSPPRPSAVAPQLPLDVVTIILHAMQRESHRRYPSAAELRDDVERFLRHEPIRARSVGPVERAWKFIRRNRALTVMSILAAISTGALIISQIDSLKQEVRSLAREADKVEGVGQGIKNAFPIGTTEDRPTPDAPRLAFENAANGAPSVRITLDDVPEDGAGIWNEGTWRVRLTPAEAAECGAAFLELTSGTIGRVSNFGERFEDSISARWSAPKDLWDPPRGPSVCRLEFAMLADVDSATPGRELIVGHYPDGEQFPLNRISVLHVYNLRLDALHELWTWGRFTGAAWDAKAGHLVVSLHCGKLMDCDPELVAYDRLFCGEVALNVPMIAAIKPEHLDGVLFPYRLEIPPTTVEWALVRRPIELRDPASPWIVSKLDVAPSGGSGGRPLQPVLRATVMRNKREMRKGHPEFRTQTLLGPDGTLLTRFDNVPTSQPELPPLLDDQFMRVDFGRLIAGRRLAEPLLLRVADLDEALAQLDLDATLSSNDRTAACGAAAAMWSNWRWLHFQAGTELESGRSLSDAEKRRYLRWAERSCELHDARCPDRGVCTAEWYARSVLGVAQFQCERYDDALATFQECERRARTNKPGGASGDTGGIAYQAMCLHRLGREAEAKATLLRAIDDLERSSNTSGEASRVLEDARRLLGEKPAGR